MKNLLKYSNLAVITFIFCTLSCKKQIEKTNSTTINSTVEETNTVRKEATNNTLESKTSTPTKTTTANIENGIEKIPVVFNTGQKTKIIQDQITGREIHDYTFNIDEGQHLKVVLTPSSGMPYFNLMEPEEEFSAIYIGSINGNQYDGVSKKNGAYTVRVYLMRNAARRNDTGKYKLEISID